MNKTQKNFVERLQQWAAHPITGDMDLLSVFLAVGLVMVAAIAWRQIINLITEA